MNSSYAISTDKTKLDVEVIHDFLSNRSYWGKGRTLETVQKTIDNSLCFGVYDKEDQLIGFARVVTDYAIFAYLMDVFVLEDYRRAGIGKQLIRYIVDYPDLKNIQRWRLDTLDAHELYKKYGFRAPEFPEKIMEKKQITK